MSFNHRFRVFAVGWWAELFAVFIEWQPIFIGDRKEISDDNAEAFVGSRF